MILPESEIMERVESPMNLLNRLRSAVSPHKSLIPSIPAPTSDELVPNLNEKITLGSAKSKAISIMNEAMDELKKRLPDVQRPEKLAAIADSMGKIVTNASQQAIVDNRVGQIIIYAPRMVSEEEFDVVDARAMEQ